MDRSQFLLRGLCWVGAVGFSIVLFLPLPANAVVLGCSASGTRQETCSAAQTSGNAVDVWASQSSSGTSSGGTVAGGQDGTTNGGSSGSASGVGAASGGNSATTPWSFYPRILDTPWQVWGKCLVLVNRPTTCVPGTPAVTTPAGAPVTEAAYVAPVITVTDIASFSPQQPTLTPEPLGWAIVGLESNMLVGTSRHVAAGPLLGAAAEVRFTPARFDFTYGDGATRSASSAGTSWASRGLPEFSRTETSHAYSQSGTYRASVRVAFSLEYRWGNGAWTSIDGLVYGTASAPVVLVLNAVNVLVTQACTPGIEAPGC